ncbi:hypothetical protein M0804_013874 [Polistes exclamans]|nr:hypothetical protein M0804_013874 [Polistes exclamans]
MAESRKRSWTSDCPIQKPLSIIDYNKYMKGVNRADQYLSYYSIFKKTKKWTKRVVMFFINCALFNSFKVYKTPNGHKITYKNFLHKAALSLIEDCETKEQNKDLPNSELTRTTSRFDHPGRLANFGKHKLVNIVTSGRCKKPLRQCRVCASKKKRSRAGFAWTSFMKTTRRNSPSRLPTELILKYQSQFNRLKFLISMEEELPTANATTLGDVETDQEHLERIHREFTSTHKYSELNWLAAFLNHAYLTEKVHQQEAKMYRKLRLALNKVRRALAVEPSPLPPEQRIESKLTDIQLKSFFGEYNDWPGFKAMFKSLILRNDRISDFERLHYFRSCVHKVLQLNSSRTLHWRAPPFSRRGICSTLAMKTSGCSSRFNSTGCAELPHSYQGLQQDQPTHINCVRSQEGFGIIGSGGESGRHHPGAPCSASIGSHDSGKLGDLAESEAAPARSSTSRTQAAISRSQLPRKPTSTHQAATQQESSQTKTRLFYCDCCHGKHFIVTYPQFRALNITARCSIVTDAWLCHNCLGRHNANLCRTNL